MAGANGETIPLIPLRHAAEALGYTVEWQAEQKRTVVTGYRQYTDAAPIVESSLPLFHTDSTTAPTYWRILFDGDIIDQYVRFCKIADEERKRHGRSGKAIEETLRRCIEENVLAPFLMTRQKEIKFLILDKVTSARPSARPLACPSARPL